MGLDRGELIIYREKKTTELRIGIVTAANERNVDILWGGYTQTIDYPQSEVVNEKNPFWARQIMTTEQVQLFTADLCTLIEEL